MMQMLCEFVSKPNSLNTLDCNYWRRFWYLTHWLVTRNCENDDGDSLYSIIDFMRYQSAEIQFVSNQYFSTILEMQMSTFKKAKYLILLSICVRYMKHWNVIQMIMKQIKGAFISIFNSILHQDHLFPGYDIKWDWNETNQMCANT